MVEAREIDGSANTSPLLWRLLTTRPVGTAADAHEIVRLYRLRWRIEEVFRALKSDGMRLEETQLEQAGRLFKLAVVGLAAATRMSIGVQTGPPIGVQSEPMRLALRMLKAKLRRRATMPGLVRIREASSLMVTSRL